MGGGGVIHENIQHCKGLNQKYLANRFYLLQTKRCGKVPKNTLS